ncbi:carboxypeptidase-like regulatory domain-containing protein [Fulvivirgaceae bacterium BMA12]|uniref:Carboxypeptidase-like regulatory domain-containing protein n=1 Tax=Agaribacillus aureus TaxID=3051825 RepID=A0ABT8L9C4_9BACT|nr:carboxypeptidase-like regulatory domain-containing protein [Fulvivirgaceae bacterium BMA12]
MNDFQNSCFTIAVLFVFIDMTNAQHRLRGVVVSELGEPLAYATISIKNSSVGTISNLDGKFTFSIPAMHVDDTLIISMLGYESLALKISNLDISQNLKLSLKEKIFELEEVTISVKGRTGEEILKEAFKKQKENSPQSDYMLELFVRELFYFNDSCYAVVESAAELFGEKFPKPGFDIYLDQIRHAIDRQPELPTSMTDYNPFRDFRGMIGSKGRILKPCGNCDYEIEKYTYIDNQPVVVISLPYKLKGANPSYFRYVIRLDNYAILKVEFETNVSFGNAFVHHHDSITSSLVSLKRVIEYNGLDGHYYLKSYRQQAKREYRTNNDSLKYETRHNFLVLANSAQTQKVGEMKAKKANANLMDYQSTLFSQSKDNNPVFWDNYNLVERTPAEDRLYNSLSKNQ